METFSLFFVCGGPLLWKTLQHNLCIGSIWMVFWENLQQSIHCISIYLLFQIICFKLYRLIRQSCLLALFWKLSREMDERKKQSLKTNFPDSSSASLMKKYLTLFEDGDFQIEFWLWMTWLEMIWLIRRFRWLVDKNNFIGLSTSASAKSSNFKHPNQLMVTLVPQTCKWWNFVLQTVEKITGRSSLPQQPSNCRVL